MKEFWRKSAYGCKYRIEFNPSYIKGVELTFLDRVKLAFGADLIIVHHSQQNARPGAEKSDLNVKLSTFEHVTKGFDPSKIKARSRSD